jgi:hypothetical protein
MDAYQNGSRNDIVRDCRIGNLRAGNSLTTNVEYVASDLLIGVPMRVIRFQGSARYPCVR